MAANERASSTSRAAQQADISVAVIHDRAKRKATARRSEGVNNCAGADNWIGARPALARSRSQQANCRTIRRRLPGEPVAAATTSNRKRPQEGRQISSVDGRAKRRNQHQQAQQTMNDSPQWQQYQAFGALDWGSQTHSVIVIDAAGKVIEDFAMEQSALGWQQFRQKLQVYGSIAFAIETSQGAAVEQLLEAGMRVYPLNPTSAQAYRQGKAPSGVKDDRLDAWSFADALRLDGHGLLSEIGDDRQRFDADAQALPCFGGTAPVTIRSGKERKYWPVHQRRACDKHLRHALHLFAEQSLSRCVWAQIYYQHHRQKNQSHANALRRLAHRWLKIIHKMWLDRTPYNAELHHPNQLQHGSWIFQLQKS
jgi:Transposase/Transposase IS116/IS110/IS902 family